MISDSRRVPPELELLVLTARQSLRQEQGDRIGELIDRGLDWEMVLRRGRALRVQGFLWRHLGSGAFDIPGRVRKHLEHQYGLQAIINLRIWTQLKEIGEAAEKAGIRLVLLKGSYLAYWLYEDPALRPMGDLDFLCPETDFQGLQQVLKRLDYSYDSKLSQPDPFSHLPAFKRGRSAKVEVCLNLHSGLPPNRVLERSQTVTRDGIRFFTLAFPDLVEEQFAHAALHLAHYSFSLLWITDIAEILERHRPVNEERKHPARKIWRDPYSAAIWSFLNLYWFDPRTAGLQVPHPIHRRILSLIAASRRAQVPSGYLQKLREVGRWQGTWLKLRYLRWLIFPPLRHVAEAYYLTSRTYACAYYLFRYFAIPGRVIRSALLARRFR